MELRLLCWWSPDRREMPVCMLLVLHVGLSFSLLQPRCHAVVKQEDVLGCFLRYVTETV